MSAQRLTASENGSQPKLPTASQATDRAQRLTASENGSQVVMFGKDPATIMCSTPDGVGERVTRDILEADGGQFVLNA